MSPAVELIIVPYDSALKDARMGRGPNALLARGLKSRLERDGVTVRLTAVEPEQEFSSEIATAFELQRAVRRAVEMSVAAGRRPITLSGNCNTGVLGSLAAAGDEQLGLFWFDAHSDAATPESTTTGFLDGMGLAMALRCCWSAMLDSVGSWTLDGSRAVLVGAREITNPAQILLDERGVSIVSPADAQAGAIEEPIRTLRESGVRRIHVHLDVDVLDPETVGPANGYALPGGLTEAQLNRVLQRVLDSFDLASASLASYDPAVDESGAVGAAAVNLVAQLANA